MDNSAHVRIAFLEKRIGELEAALRNAMRCRTQEEWRAWVRSQPAYQSDTEVGK